MEPASCPPRGTLRDSATLFDALAGESPAFSVHHGDDPRESLAELVPDRPAGECWNRSMATPAKLTLERGTSGSFAIKATSPLFRDMGNGTLVLRAWGTDADGQPALLGSHSIAVAEG